MLNKRLLPLTLLTTLSGCGLTSTQAVYEEIRAQERTQAAGTSAPPNPGLPRYNEYQKERSVLSPSTR